MHDSLIRNSIADVQRLVPLVLRRTWLPLLILFFGKEASLQLLNYAGVLVQREGREDFRLIVAVVGSNVFFEILWSAIWSFFVISATRSSLRDEPLFSSTSLGDLNQTLIEGVRALSAIAFRLPLLVVPALIEIVRLFLVPHVVLLDPAYRKGRVDALKESRQFVRPIWGWLVLSYGLLFVSTVVVESFTQGEAGEAWFWSKPLAFALTTVLTLLLNLVYEVFLVALFIRLSVRMAVQAGPEPVAPSL